MFGSRKKTVVSGIIQAMNDKDKFRYSSKDAISQWIWDRQGRYDIRLDDKDAADYIIEANNHTLHKQFNRAYSWAKKEGRYSFGLPKSSIIVNPIEQLIKNLTKLLNKIHEPDTIIIENAYVGDIDFYMTVWLKLVNDYGYDSFNNELTKLTRQFGFPCYLKDGVLHITQRTQDDFIDEGIINDTLAFSYGQCFERLKDIHATQTDLVLSQDTDKCVISFEYEEEYLPEANMDTLDTPIQIVRRIGEFEIDLSFINPQLQEHEPLPPEHDWIYSTYKIANTYYWFGYELGTNNIPELEKFDEGKSLLGEFYPRLYVRNQQKNIIDTDKKKEIEKIFKKINLPAKEITQEIQKSIGDEYHNVHGLYLFMGARLTDSLNNDMVAEYLFRYFKRIYDMVGSQGALNRVEDNLSHQSFSWSGITLKENTGVIHQLRKNKFHATKSSYHYKTKRGGLNRLIGRKRKAVDYTYHFYHQITDDSYIEITVENLQQYTYLSGYGFNKTASDDNLVIPIDRTLIREMTNKEREKLFYLGFHICGLHVVVVKKKWYQTPLFYAVMVAITIAVTYAFAPAGTALSTIVKSAMINAVKTAVVSFAVGEVIKLLVKEGIISAKAGVILQAVISIATMAYGVGGFDFSKVLTAPNMMKIVNTSFDAYNKLNQLKIQEVQTKMKELGELQAKRDEIIKRTQQLLNTKVFDPEMELLQSSFTPTVNLSETPELFYYRHQAFDVVQLSFDLITNHVQGSLANIQPRRLSTPDVEEVLYL